MGRFPQQANSKGSLRAIQMLVNECTDWFNSQILIRFPHFKNFKWLSPVRENDYTEYSDQDFLQVLGIKDSVNLSTFWPSGGPHWDALGKADQDGCLLVEAKAHITELASSMKAEASKSIQQIRTSLVETKTFLGIDPAADWEKTYYQYANRLAHLYFLRERCKLDAYLVFVYILGDSVMSGPKTEKEWEVPLQDVKSKLGIPDKHPLSPYIHNVFIYHDLMCKNAKLGK